MRTVYSDKHQLQDGEIELVGDRLERPAERPERAHSILAAIEASGLGPVQTQSSFGKAPILRVHDHRFVRFLEEAWDLWSAEHGPCNALPPTACTRDLRSIEPQSIDGRLSYYARETGTPITAGTWEAAVASCDVAATCVDLIDHGESAAFGLCRPPGHHAMRDYFGGYCFLNNAAVAAQKARDQGASRVAILDVDYHHGNGTQSLFFDRPDVLFVSLHADPATDYPFFLGYADETGAGAGEGFNLNLPLPRGTSWSTYRDALDVACRRIRRFTPDLLIVSLGVDTYEGDPISAFAFRQQDFSGLGSHLGKLGTPTLFLLEGGYAVEDIGSNVTRVLTSFEEDHGADR